MPRSQRLALVSIALFALSQPVYALNPKKKLSQYSRSLWTQQQGLPQDTVRAITQTSDGFLWIGTNEGLARFDGFDFVTFTKENSDLPGNSINALSPGPEGSLWVGTSYGLAQYREGTFKAFHRKHGLEDEAISSVVADASGGVWFVTNGNISRLTNGKVTVFRAGADVPIQAIRALAKDRENRIYAVGWTAVARFEKDKFISIAGVELFADNLPQNMIVDRKEGLWVLGTRGLVHRPGDGISETYRAREGLSDAFGTNAVLEDRDGNLWVGTDRGLARLDKGRFETRTEEGLPTRGAVSALFEDREGNLWVGSDAGLMRLRDDIFTIFGKPEGLPSNEPSALFQDQMGRMWAGFGDGGVAIVSGGSIPASVKPKLPKGRVFSIRESRSHEIFVAARDGLLRIQGDRISTYIPDDPLQRKSVYDALETADGRIWLALPNGLATLRGSTELRWLINAGTSRSAYPLTLASSRDGSIWAGTEGKGLWHITGSENHETTKQYTAADGLGSESIRSLYEDASGTLWIGTAGGGLSAFRNGEFYRITAQNGLPSDNITKVIDDGRSLWLSTPRGIAAIPKQQLEDFLNRKIQLVQPTVYGLNDGLRSTESPILGSGGTLNTDGTIWFTTNGGIAVFHPEASHTAELPPLVHIVAIQAGDRTIGVTSNLEIEPTWGTPLIRYTAIHLSGPFRLKFFYKLDGLDTEWTNAGTRRTVTYPRLSHGRYTFHVKAQLPDGTETEKAITLTVLPRYYETAWFRFLCLSGVAWAVWAGYRLRVRQVQARFQTVLDERARLAREVHDTLAQAFVGISTQLEVVDSYMPPGDSPGRQSLDIAKRMSQHSLTEARRSVMDLRAAALDELDLGGALQFEARQWTMGSGLEVNVNVTGDTTTLPEQVAHHVLRIAQEGVNNVVKHAHARSLRLALSITPHRLELQIQDDGCGFEPEGMLLSSEANFGLMGMRERAERLGGEFELHSRPGHGTELRITVPK